MLSNGHLANPPPPQLSTWFMNDPLCTLKDLVKKFVDSLSDCMTYQECLVIVSSLFMHKEVQYSLIMHTLHNTYRTEYTLCILYSITYFNTMNGVKISGHYPNIPCFQTSTLDWFQVEIVQTSGSEIMKIYLVITNEVLFSTKKFFEKL